MYAIPSMQPAGIACDNGHVSQETINTRTSRTSNAQSGYDANPGPTKALFGKVPIMKSAIAVNVSCISALVLFAGFGNARAATPVLKTPPSSIVSSFTESHTFGSLSKPEAGSQVNWSNALSAGLVSLVALNEGSGNAFYDAATGQTYHAVSLHGTPAGAFPPTWFAPALGEDYPWEGPALANNGGTAQAIESYLPPSQFISKTTTGYSYAVLVQPLNTTTFGRIMDATGAAATNVYLNIPGHPGQIATTWRNSSDISINPYCPFTNDKWILVLCTVRQGLGVMYVNGVEVAHDTTVNLAMSVTNQTGSLVYNSSGGGGNMPNANFSSWWVWNNRVLTAAEAAEFYQDPWSMLR